MEFTGERFLPGIEGNIELEHIHRYLFSKTLVENLDVLDIACGEGYGSYILSEEARRVYGFDISLETIKQAQNKYTRSNLEFRVGDCRDIPLANNSIDVAISFETIEHIKEHDQFLPELKRVLRKDGILIISSPDKQNYTLETGIKNPFHEKELFDFEFRELISSLFKNARYFGQRVVFGSGIIESNNKNTFISYAPTQNYYQTNEGLINPTYWIAVASDANVPELTNSLYERSINESEVVLNWIKIRDDALEQIREKDTQQEINKKSLIEKDEEVLRLNSLIESQAAEQEINKKSLIEKDEEVLRLNSLIESQAAEQEANSKSLIEKDEEVLRLNSLVESQVAEQEANSKSLIEKDEVIIKLNSIFVSKISALENLIENKNKQIEQNSATQRELQIQINALNQKLADKQRELKESDSTISQIMTSRSWVITRPLRKLIRGLKRGTS